MENFIQPLILSNMNELFLQHQLILYTFVPLGNQSTFINYGKFTFALSICLGTYIHIHMHVYVYKQMYISVPVHACVCLAFRTEWDQCTCHKSLRALLAATMPTNNANNDTRQPYWPQSEPETNAASTYLHRKSSKSLQTWPSHVYRPQTAHKLNQFVIAAKTSEKRRKMQMKFNCLKEGNLTRKIPYKVLVCS